MIGRWEESMRGADEVNLSLQVLEKLEKWKKKVEKEREKERGNWMQLVKWES